MKNYRNLHLAILIFCISGCVKTIRVDDLCTKIANDTMKTIAEWYYCGTKDGYHYFYNFQIAFGAATYRINENELRMKKKFPLTKDMDKWLLQSWGSPHPDNRHNAQDVVDPNTGKCFELIILKIEDDNSIYINEKQYFKFDNKPAEEGAGKATAF